MIQFLDCYIYYIRNKNREKVASKTEYFSKKDHFFFEQTTTNCKSIKIRNASFKYPGTSLIPTGYC
jgi:hypothetical protein